MTKKSSAAAKPAESPSAPPPVSAPPVSVALPPEIGQEFNKLLGEVCWLMSRAPHRRFAFMGDLEWLVMPALALGQARLYRNEKKDPVSYISWATVSDEVNERLKAGVARLQPAEWRSGPHIWIFDILAPFGGAEESLQTLKSTVFPDKSVAVLPLGGKSLDEILAARKSAQT